ncbi:HlyD family type I secretion periplasmic adaptor subunit [Pseudoalteromonas sp. C2R02]|uniref:HlyD family type I secretion periplasmic adaptor subunit n=1 Tax=Pseudoalteromonas sp. C2R02 TaxID=2841565 RepID=UPI001C083047|nr:HlyD family type I secretion periplasmic adaptor subunit [Pseudoalteromonas sp. C2R02]MBU2971109.1 HlyD family type I secretion periplasmic adaptor subunit [Pseudoalteromonas sp. C2R02]
MKDNSFKEIDTSFIDDINAAILLTSPNRSRNLLYVITGFCFCVLIWAYFAALDEVTVGSGKVIPSSQIQVVQNLEGGILSKIFIKEGQKVTKGEELLRIDDTRFLADFREKEQEVMQLQRRAVRLKAELASVKWSKNISPRLWKQQIKIIPQSFNISLAEQETFSDIYRTEVASFNANISNFKKQLNVMANQIQQKEQEVESLKSRVKHVQTSYQLGLEELNLTEPLANKGVISPVEFLKLKRQINELKQQMEEAELALPRSRTALTESISKRQTLVSEYQKETQELLTKVEAQLAQLTEKQVNLKDKVNRTSITSPVTGTIKALNVNTEGGVIQPGMDLVEIVPIEDQLLIEAKVSPKDIAFLRPGLKAIVRFTAYDFAIYGGIEGKLENISADSFEDEKGVSYYLITVRTEDNYLGDKSKKLPIIPGMTASVDVMTGKKTVLEYLLKPILRAQQSALRER